MDIAGMNVKITFQKNTLVTDRIGNHTNVWTDYYPCHAAVSGENGSANGGETEAAGTTVDHSNTDFTVRFCSLVKAVTQDEYRIIMNGEIYNIIGIDHMQYKGKAYKFRCRKERR